MKDRKTKHEFIEMRAKGWSLDRIARRLGVSKQTLITWSKELSLQIENLKTIELEALQEKFCVAKMSRIKLFGERLNAVSKELNKRQLSDMPTASLVELQMRYSKVLQEEETEVVFQEEVEVGGPEELLASLKTLRQFRA